MRMQPSSAGTARRSPLLRWVGAVVVAGLSVSGVVAQTGGRASPKLPVPLEPPSAAALWPTWLHTPQERRAIERGRHADAQTTGEDSSNAPIVQYWRLDGVVFIPGRSARSAWINGEMWESGMSLGPGTVLESVGAGHVTLRMGDRRVTLMVGDMVSSAGEVIVDAARSGVSRSVGGARVEK